MNISYSEAGDYFRGLLLLIRKDHKIIEEEKTLLMRFGKSLGFASTFCAGAVSEIIENKYISDSPPVFSLLHIVIMNCIPMKNNGFVLLLNKMELMKIGFIV
jgi:hypothetical protein